MSGAGLASPWVSSIGHPMFVVGEFLASHPGTASALEQCAETRRPPRSYATAVYNACNAFVLVDVHEGRRHVRWSWQPEAGVEYLTEEERASADRDYLQTEILERLPARMTLVAQLAEDGDPVDDCTVAWPAERETVELGTLEITGPDTETDPDGFNVYPNRLPDGIELSDDPILNVRPRAYSISIERRGKASRTA